MGPFRQSVPKLSLAAVLHVILSTQHIATTTPDVCRQLMLGNAIAVLEAGRRGDALKTVESWRPAVFEGFLTPDEPPRFANFEFLDKLESFENIFLCFWHF